MYVTGKTLVRYHARPLKYLSACGRHSDSARRVLRASGFGVIRRLRRVRSNGGFPFQKPSFSGTVAGPVALSARRSCGKIPEKRTERRTAGTRLDFSVPNERRRTDVGASDVFSFRAQNKRLA